MQLSFTSVKLSVWLIIWQSSSTVYGKWSAPQILTGNVTLEPLYTKLSMSFQVMGLTQRCGYTYCLSVTETSKKYGNKTIKVK